jgi:hypothetical protein
MASKMVNPGINDRFYINPKTIEIVAIDLANLPKNLASTSMNIVSLVHTLGFAYATAPFAHPDG